MGKVVKHFLRAVCVLFTRATLQSTEATDLASSTPKATVFVTCQPCLTGACRTGHQMDNIMSAFIAAALMDGRGPGHLPWRYLHQTSNRRNGNDAAAIFALDAYKDATKGFERVNLPSLSAKVHAKDPAATPGYTGERWHGHADYDKVMKVLTSAGQQCANQQATKRGGDSTNNVKPLACVLELQYAWRLTLPRVYVWTQTKGLRVEVLQTVRAQLLSLYCQRMSRVPATRALLFEAAAANNATNALSSSSSSSSSLHHPHLQRGHRDIRRRRQLRIANGKESTSQSNSFSAREDVAKDERGKSASLKKHHYQRRRALKFMGRREEEEAQRGKKKKTKKANDSIGNGDRYGKDATTSSSSSSVVAKVALVEKHMRRELAKEGARLEQRFDDSSLWRRQRRQLLQTQPCPQRQEEQEQFQQQQRSLRLRGSFPLVKHNSKHQKEEEKAEARAAAAAERQEEEAEAEASGGSMNDGSASSVSVSSTTISTTSSNGASSGSDLNSPNLSVEPPAPPLRIVVHARRGDRVRDSDSAWVSQTGGDVASIAQIVGSIAAQAEVCGLGEAQQQQQQGEGRGIEVSVHSESSNSEDLYEIPWDETTLRLMRLGAKKRRKMKHAGDEDETLPSDDKLAKVFTTNALSVDLAHFVASDVFVMAASALSNLAAFLRGARSDWSSGSSGGGGFVVTDLRNDHLPEVQYPDDPILAHPDPAFYHGWNATLGFVASDDERDGKHSSLDSSSSSSGDSHRLQHAPRCALFAAPSPPQPVCAALPHTSSSNTLTPTSRHPYARSRNRLTTHSQPLSNQSQATSSRHALLGAANIDAAARASKAAAAKQRSQAAIAGAAAHVHRHAQLASPIKTSPTSSSSSTSKPPSSLLPSSPSATTSSSSQGGVEHRLPAQSAPHLVEAYLEKGQLKPPRPPIQGMEGKHVKHPFGLFG